MLVQYYFQYHQMLQDTNNVQYDTSNLNGLAAVGLEAADNIMNVGI